MDLEQPACCPEVGSAQQAEPETVPPGDADFRVLKSGAATWKIVAVSLRAHEFLHGNLAPGGENAQAGVVFTDHRGVNGLILHVRARGYTTELIGPRGPVRV